MVLVVESVQVVLFLHTQSPASALDHFQTGFGNSPTAFQTSSPEQSQASVSWDMADLTLFTQPGRVDFLVQPRGAIAGPLGHGAFRVQEALNSIFSAISKIAPSLSVGRTATVAQGHVPAADADDALAKVREMVPGLPMKPDASDLTFQITQRKPSAIAPHRMVKRMVRWETAQLQYLEMQIGAPVAPRVITQGHMAHKYVDVFSENMEPLSSEQVHESVSEITELARALLIGSFDDIN